ncbi:binding-protein-dependent transport systems inner membrane component [Beutenbergia cavernae DSM 12333]|uniref:Binding-protein-dependent transport systems inner membrane component n=1 Tax=Beutenbergia cavernae (strain ATCC BAA-8 / DSM 12333 / CCUG 43141 / JCM 11478 / NBRC 16432 / NCIMB 13614 / HKI 0122) TaxID=471853 RepID=C5BV61_BEUC1|nr:ABC transporter permease [Beutenbergia cavernae]ACQ80448.1 binding-protein-dependent transport systems inner membrane component [Beutenbergia cavernae DSM 12333]
MTRLIVRRLALLVPTLFGLSILLFLWVRALPGGPAVALLGERATPESIAELNRVYGFDRPLPEQYLTYVSRMISGDFGVSIRTRRPVIEEFASRFPATLELTIFALVFAVVIGLALGYVAARHHGKVVDHASVVVSLLGVTVPVFFLAFMLKYVFAVQLGWFYTTGRQSQGLDATHYTGLYVLDGVITGEWDAAWDAFMHLVLPAIALGTIPLAIITRMTRASVIEVQGADYVRTARAKGLRSTRLRNRVVLRNAMLPVVTTIGLQVGLLLSGAVLTETVFAFPGIGSFLYESITASDYPVLQGFILVIAVIYALVNLAVDVSYGVIDPRMRAR